MNAQGRARCLVGCFAVLGLACASLAKAQIYANCTNQVPAMTSNTTPQGQVTRSGVHDASFEAWKAFDSSNSSMWISQTWQTPAWIAYDWGSPRYVNKYSISYVNGSITSRAPRDWQLQGWNGSSWVSIDTRAGQTNWTGNETRSFVVTLPGSYSRYRLHITDDNDVRSGIVVISMGRLTLESCSDTGFCGSGMLCSSEPQCDQICPGQCISGCCYCY